MKKTLLITHTDLDGISPIVLLNLTRIKFDFKSIEISEIDETFDLLFNEETKDYQNYTNMFIVDLSLTEHAYDLLNNHEVNVKVFDHHATHLFANKYPYVQVSVELNGRKTCGTELFYEYLKDKYEVLNKDIVKDYVELVRQKDVFEFTSDKPKELEILMNTYGKTDFIKFMTRRLKKDKSTLEFSAFEKRYLKLETEARDRYIYSRELKMKTYTINGLKCGVVFAERYKDDLGNNLSIKYPELDAIILLNFAGGVSYRTDRDDVDLGIFAQNYGGGGHKKASGSRITDEFKEIVLKEYFKDITPFELIKEEDEKASN